MIPEPSFKIYFIFFDSWRANQLCAEFTRGCLQLRKYCPSCPVTCDSDDKQACFKSCNFLIGVWCDAGGAQNWRQFAESKTQTSGNDSVKHRLITPHQNTELELGLLMARLKCGLKKKINIQLFRRNQEASLCWREAVVKQTSPGFNKSTCA